MFTFSYRAVDEQGKEVSGSLDAVSMDAARNSLSELHLDVVELTEAMRARPRAREVSSAPSLSLHTYSFEATDERGAVRRGSIQATDQQQALSRLENDQKLHVASVRSIGSEHANPLPSLALQRDVPWTTVEPSTAVPEPPKQPRPLASVSFRLPVQGLAGQPPHQLASASGQRGIARGIGVVRLYAGWLLGWYGLFIGLGYYVHERALPLSIPAVEGFYVSSFIFSCTLFLFLLLLLTSIHRTARGGALLAVALTLTKYKCSFLSNQ